MYNFDEVPLHLSNMFGCKMNRSRDSNQNVVVWLSSTVDTTKRFGTIIPTVRADGYQDDGKNPVPPVLIFKGNL